MTIGTTDSEPLLDAGRARVVALVVAVSFFMQLLDSTIVVTSLPQMATDFGVEPVAMSIGLTAYLLSMAAFIPLSGWLGDRFGARTIFMVSIAIFTLASLACGLSANLEQFIAARAIQGFGAALMTPVGRVIVLRNAPKSELVNAVALITWPALIAPVIGPVIGGMITTYASWHWNFHINVPIGIIGLVLTWRFVPDQREPDAGQLDIPGFLLSALGLCLLLAGLETFTQGTAALPLVALLLAGGMVLGVTATWHFRRVANPLLDLSAFRVQTFALSTLSAGTALRTSINATPFLIPLMLQVGFRYDAIRAGTYLLVYFAGNLAMKTVTTRTLRAFGFRRVLVVNGLIACGSIIACGFLTPATPDAITLTLLFIAGLSRSMQFTALNTIGFADIAPAQRSSASTLSSMLQQVSMLLGVAVAAAVLNLSGLIRDGAGTPLTDFRWAFAVIGAIGVLASLRFLALPADAGSEVSGHRATP
ncbi:DHA2 family efflux MFS transporter permease subunit [Rhizobium sp.]